MSSALRLQITGPLTTCVCKINTQLLKTYQLTFNVFSNSLHQKLQKMTIIFSTSQWFFYHINSITPCDKLQPTITNISIICLQLCMTSFKYISSLYTASSLMLVSQANSLHNTAKWVEVVRLSTIIFLYELCMEIWSLSYVT